MSATINTVPLLVVCLAWMILGLGMGIFFVWRDFPEWSENRAETTWILIISTLVGPMVLAVHAVCLATRPFVNKKDDDYEEW